MYIWRSRPLLIWLVLLPTAGLADSWEITQTVSVDNDLNMNQEGGNSIQSANLINFGDLASVENTNQSVKGSGNNTITLQQNNSSGNRQALNYIKASNTTNARQSIESVGIINLVQNNGSSNIQAGNLLETTSIGAGISQTLSAATVNFTLNDDISNTSPNIQAGNLALINSTDESTFGQLQQTFNANKVSLAYPTSTTGSPPPTYGGYQGEGYKRAANMVNTP